MSSSLAVDSRQPRGKPAVQGRLRLRRCLRARTAVGGVLLAAAGPAVSTRESAPQSAESLYPRVNSRSREIQVETVPPRESARRAVKCR